MAARPVALLGPAASPWLVRVTAVCCLFGAEAVHVAVLDEHIDEWLPAGLFFLGLSLAEGALAVALIVAPSRNVARLVVGISLATVVLWLTSRSFGLPIGPMTGVAEPVGRADTVATVLELVTAAALLAPTTVTTATTVRRRSAVDYVRVVLIAAAVFAFTAFGVAPDGPEPGAPLDLTPSVPAEVSDSS